MIHWLRTIDYCFRFSFCLLTYVNFLHFLDNDDRISSKRRNLSVLVFCHKFAKYPHEIYVKPLNKMYILKY